MILRPWSKSHLPAEIKGNHCEDSKDHYFYPNFMKLAKNVYFGDFLEKLKTGSPFFKS